MPPQGASGAPEAREARDVMAFGQEIGRVLSDGRVVGRAEPFAKVFPSSRLVKKAVGLAAWGVLEDIALDATLDERGRLVAETNVRRIAHHLGLNKDTVTRHLRRLREYGFVLQEEERSAGSGRYEACRYVLDPSACVERFTVTPTAQRNRSSHPCPKLRTRWRVGPCPRKPDMVAPDTVKSDSNIEMLLFRKINNNSRAATSTSACASGCPPWASPTVSLTTSSAAIPLSGSPTSSRRRRRSRCGSLRAGSSVRCVRAGTSPRSSPSSRPPMRGNDARPSRPPPTVARRR
jgi:DNA-binding transcriptional ArsR family regulator